MSEQATSAAPEALKAAKKKTSKPVAAAPPSNGLRKTQVRVLQVLAKASPMTRAKLKEKANVDISVVVGCQDDAARAASDAKHNVKSLLTLGYVRFKDRAVEKGMAPETVYEITAPGRKALAKAK